MTPTLEQSPVAILIDVSLDRGEAGWDEVRRLAREAPTHGGPTQRPLGDDSNLQLERVIEIAKAHGVATVLCESRYIDPDWQSEHAIYYGRTFDRPPNTTRRLHLFTELIDSLEQLSLAPPSSYRGYVVLRPLATAPVGRTMIAPPPDLADATLCLGKERVRLFGRAYEVEAMPFISQDSRLLICAHASIWMVLYHAKLHHRMPRRVSEDIWRAASGGMMLGRQLPHDGMSVAQMLVALDQLGISARRTAMKGLQWNPDPTLEFRRSRTLATACSYVNSQMPPLVYSESHVSVVAGYLKTAPGDARSTIAFVLHDDARGPYLLMEQPVDQPWWGMVAPLQRNVFISAEHAQRIGRAALRRQADRAPEGELARALADDQVALRTYGLLAADYRERMDARLPPAVAELFRYVSWPKGVWVVEALDRDRWDHGDRTRPHCVIGEVIIDATAEVRPFVENPRIVPKADVARATIGLYVGGTGVVIPPDGAMPIRVQVADAEIPYPSGCPATPW